MASRGERLKAGVRKDANLLATGCGALSDLQGECTTLFRRYPDLQQALQNEWSYDDRPLGAKLKEIAELTERKTSELQSLGGQQAAVDTEELGGACSTLEHAFGAYVSGVAEFESLFTQEISPWTATTGLPEVEGIGPLATEITTAYSRLREVLRASSRLREGYEKLVRNYGESASKGEPLSRLNCQGPVLAKELVERASTLRHLTAGGLISVGPAATACL